jgi:TFIIF-interacting CTD phosphatase-like protein
MTLRIFHSINFIKQLSQFPVIPESKKIDFKFKKEGFNKLLIFDLDETLIHSIQN